MTKLDEERSYFELLFKEACKEKAMFGQLFLAGFFYLVIFLTVAGNASNVADQNAYYQQQQLSQVEVWVEKNKKSIKK